MNHNAISRRSILQPTFGFALECLVAGILLSTFGCEKSTDSSLEALPWKATSHDSPSNEVMTPVSATAQPAAALDPRELEFRDRVAKLYLDDLRRLAANPVAVEAVETANANNWQTPEQILQTDQQWRQTRGVSDPLVQKYLNNPCADALRDAQREHPEYGEIFMMDNKGCLVAETNKTSDYWQGDEDKWTRSFNGGRGTVFVDDVQYDQSTRLFAIQISVPVFGRNGETIGAMTASVASDTPSDPPATR